MSTKSVFVFINIDFNHILLCKMEYDEYHKSNYNRDEYMRMQKEALQKRIVTKSTSSSPSSSSYIWTYRTTGCDVVSMVTTSKSLKNGSMKDIKLEHKELRRLKAPAKSAPLGSVNFVMHNAWSGPINREKLNKTLREEKRIFMEKLVATRRNRSLAEHNGSILIQKIYRGFAVRKHMNTIIHRQQIHKSLRPVLRDAILKHFKSITNDLEIISSWGQHRKSHQQTRFLSALRIQQWFRSLVAKRWRASLYVQSRRRLRYLCIVRLQCWARCIAATERVQTLKLFKWKLLVKNCATKIQSVWRQIMCKRRVNWLRYRMKWMAARIIQCSYRSMHSKFKVKTLKRVLIQAKVTRGARNMQKIVRGFICRRRVGRIHLRYMWLSIFNSVTRIQKIIRAFMCRRRVAQLRSEKTAKLLQDEILKDQKEMEKEEAKKAEEAEQLRKETDIFYQCKEGNIVAVNDIWSAGDVDINALDDEGCTVLQRAAILGHLDILRRCVLWGGDVNHRNANDESVLMSAIRCRKVGVVSYITTPTSYSAAKAHASSKGLSVIKFEPLTSDEAAACCVAAAIGPSFSDPSPEDPFAINKMLEVLHKTSGFSLKQPDANGRTVLHACCESGHIPTFKMILRLLPKFDVDQQDDLGRMPLHFAAATNIVLTKLLLGLEESSNIVDPMAPETQEKILTTDIDGKDVLVYAALAGQGEILNLLKATLSPGQKSASDEVGWAPADIKQVIKIAETTDESRFQSITDCVMYLIELGFDTAWSNNDDHKLCLAMAALRSGNIPLINALMDKSAIDLAQTDDKLQNCVFYACMNKNSEVLTTIYTHAKSQDCKCTHDLLTMPNEDGETALHIAATYDVSITIELLARKVIDEALQTFDNNGRTPLLTACYHISLNSIMNILNLGVDTTVKSSKAAGVREGHNAIWWLYHPSKEALRRRRPVGSQYVERSQAVSTQLGPDGRPLTAKQMKELTAERVNFDGQVLRELLNSGCSLFSHEAKAADEMNLDKHYNAKEYNLIADDPDNPDYLAFEACDIMIGEASLDLLKSLPQLLSPDACWRAIISSIRFDDGTGKMFAVLMEGGAPKVLKLRPSTGASEAEDGDVTTNLINSDENRMIGNGKKSGQFLRGRASMIAVSDTMFGLDHVRYHGRSLCAWIVMLRRSMLLQYVLRKGYSMDGVVDDDGNTMLHYAARYGSAGTLDLIISNTRLLFEKENNDGFTAGQIGAKYGDSSVIRKLFNYGGDSRAALCGCYRAWILARTLQKEKCQINTQTGRIGDDDKLYFPVTPDYIWWYNTYKPRRKADSKRGASSNATTTKTTFPTSVPKKKTLPTKKINSNINII